MAIVGCLLAVPMALSRAEEQPSSEEVTTTVYELAFLKPNAEHIDQDILKHVEPKQWKQAGGGPFTICRTKNGQLIVAATRSMHEQVSLIFICGGSEAFSRPIVCWLSLTRCHERFCETDACLFVSEVLVESMGIDEADVTGDFE